VPALIFDCDGVLAETERYLHLPAFNRAFAEFGVPLRWSEAEYAEKLRVGGGKERIAGSLTPELAADPGLVERLHARKSLIFEEMLGAQPLPARPGIARIIEAADAAGWRLAVASTSAESSVRRVVERVVGREYAARIAVFAGDAVRAKKPAPDIYELAVERLGASKDETVVIEDSRNGLLAADAAGLRCVVTVSDYTVAEDFTEAALVVTSLGDPDQPTTVIANRTTASPRGYVRLDDLEAIVKRTMLADAS
jgi:HAD superfamily hydrolase (TIGR01509 family)